jgi:hypothetical protein
MKNLERNTGERRGGDEGKVKKKVKLSRYTPWRHMGGEEV